MKDIHIVKISKQARRDLKKVPIHIALKLTAWISAVGTCGLYQVRKITGYHDEPLHGARVGMRSIRLNRAYRAIYIINDDKDIVFVEISEVTNHEY